MKRTYFSLSNDSNETSRQQTTRSTEATEAILAVEIIIVPLQRCLPRVFFLSAQFSPQKFTNAETIATNKITNFVLLL